MPFIISVNMQVLRVKLHHQMSKQKEFPGTLATATQYIQATIRLNPRRIQVLIPSILVSMVDLIISIILMLMLDFMQKRVPCNAKTAILNNSAKIVSNLPQALADMQL